jgi:hypothetical protein
MVWILYCEKVLSMQMQLKMWLRLSCRDLKILYVICFLINLEHLESFFNFDLYLIKGVYSIGISMDFKRLFYVNRILCYSIKIFIKYKQISWYSIKTFKIFFSGQWNPLVFNEDFLQLIKCLLLFKSI